jgi:hypothetical protein
MQNVVSMKKGEHSYHFKYEVNKEESIVIEAITDLLAQGKLNCFDTALIRRDMEKVQEAVNAQLETEEEAATGA